MIDDGWVTAEGTTLGADNGIGMALALATAEADLPDRIPLELLFTVDEETGLTGALNLDTAMLRGSQAHKPRQRDGGASSSSAAPAVGPVTARFPRNTAAPSLPGTAVRCSLGGLRGGHSGVDINDNRINAVVAAAGILKKTAARKERHLAPPPSRGARSSNVIPRDAEFLVRGADEAMVRIIASAAAEILRQTEPGLSFSVESCHTASSRALPWSVVGFIDDLAKGVIAMDGAIAGLVKDVVEPGGG